MRNILEAQSYGENLDYRDTIAESTEIISFSTDIRQFESFLRSINRCGSLLDAHRLNNDIIGEIRRTRSLLGKRFYL